MLLSFNSKGQKAYAKAGAVAEEVLATVSTVFAFNGQNKAIKRCVKNCLQDISFTCEFLCSLFVVHAFFFFFTRSLFLNILSVYSCVEIQGKMKSGVSGNVWCVSAPSTSIYCPSM